MMTAPSRPPVVALLLAAGTSLATARMVFADVRVVLREIKRPSPLPPEQLG